MKAKSKDSGKLRIDAVRSDEFRIAFEGIALRERDCRIVA